MGEAPRRLDVELAPAGQMVDQHDTAQAAPPGIFQKPLKRLHLHGTNPPRRQKWPGWNSRRQANQRNFLLDAQIWKRCVILTIARTPGREGFANMHHR